MSSAGYMRLGGWCAVGLLVLTAIAWGFFFGKPAAPPEPTHDELTRLTTVADEQLPDVLTAIAERLQADRRISQVVIVQAVPDGPPVVAGNTTDSDGDEEPTYWPVPWPRVVQALGSPLAAPVVVNGSYAGMNYQHRLIPLEATGTRCLLINAAAEAPRWFGYRGGLLALAGLLGAILLFSRGAEK